MDRRGAVEWERWGVGEGFRELDVVLRNGDGQCDRGSVDLAEVLPGRFKKAVQERGGLGDCGVLDDGKDGFGRISELAIARGRCVRSRRSWNSVCDDALQFCFLFTGLPPNPQGQQSPATCINDCPTKLKDPSRQSEIMLRGWIRKDGNSSTHSLNTLVEPQNRKYYPYSTASY